MGRTGVLLMAFGGPRSLDEVGGFCANLMGREPSAEVLERVRRRYLTIGGKSPLPEIAKDIASKLGEQLGQRHFDVPVTVGMRYSTPTIADGLATLVAAGVDRVVAVGLSPFESPHSSGSYRDEVLRAAALISPDLTIAEVPPFGESEWYTDMLGVTCKDALEDIAPGRNAVIFTAHSLPVDEIADSPYVESLERATRTIAANAGLAEPAGDGRQQWLKGFDAFGSGAGDTPWLLAYQSKGQRPGDWLGPDVLDVVRALPEASLDGVVFAPVAFATDHMETMYDLDVEASGLALDLGLEYVRAQVPNDSDEMIRTLVEAVLPALG